MLKQDAVPKPPTTVAEARVTPDELASALAAIEARRQAEAAHLAETIPIEQAVSELHLDSTSDEIWAEVQKQRARASARQKPPAQMVQPQPATKPRTSSRHAWMAMFTPLLIGWVLVQAGVVPHFWGPHTAAAPILRPLSAVPDGTEVYADGTALIQISDGKPLATISVSQNVSGNRWTVFKRGGHIYLHGYIESAPSLEALAGKPLNVYNDDNSGELQGDRTSGITLRVDDVPVQKSAGDGDYSGITFPNYRVGPQDALVPGR